MRGMAAAEAALQAARSEAEAATKRASDAEAAVALAQAEAEAARKLAQDRGATTEAALKRATDAESALQRSLGDSKLTIDAERIAALEQEQDDLKQMLDMLSPKGDAALFPAPPPLRLQRVPTQHGDEVAIAPGDLKVFEAHRPATAWPPCCSLHSLLGWLGGFRGLEG